MKKILGIALVVIMLATLLVACGGNGDDNHLDVPPPQDDIVNDVQTGNDTENGEVDRSLDGTFAHGAETIIFDGNTFTVSGGAGHRHFPNGTGTFEVAGGNIYFTYDDGEVEVRGFASDANSISIAGHRYPRR